VIFGKLSSILSVHEKLSAVADYVHDATRNPSNRTGKTTQR